MCRVVASHVGSFGLAPTWADCVRVALHKFCQYFHHKACQLLASFPPDSTVAGIGIIIIRVADPVGSGPFWSDPEPDPKNFHRIRIRILSVLLQCKVD